MAARLEIGWLSRRDGLQRTWKRRTGRGLLIPCFALPSGQMRSSRYDRAPAARRLQGLTIGSAVGWSYARAAALARVCSWRSRPAAIIS